MPLPQRRPAFRPTASGAVWLAIAALSLWLRAGFPVVALGGAGADDALFIRLARSLARGDWLGPYDTLTLAKGMAYPLFIAAASFTAIPLKMAEQAVYLAVAAATCRIVRRQSGSTALATALFALLAFNPVFWDRQLARVIREGLYISLSLAVVALTVAVCFHRGRRLGRLGLAAALGLVTGAFWLTREEGAWILPALGTVVLLAAAAALHTRRGNVRRLAGLGIPLALATGLFFGAVNLVAQINGRAYGNAVTTEFKSRSFLRAYGALAGIEQTAWRRYVVFPKDARAWAYAASPAATELAPFLEGAGGESWRRIGCDQTWQDRAACPEILAGWFMWALRDAATTAGHTRSAGDAAAFYDRVADQIDAACDAGRIRCTAAHRATLMPPFRWHYLADALARSRYVAAIVLTLGGGNLETPPSTGALAMLAAFRDLVGPIAPSTEVVEQRITGWAAATGGLPVLAVSDGPGAGLNRQFLRGGEDIEQLFPGMRAVRFELVTTCHPERCALVVSAPGASPESLPWASLVPGRDLDGPAVKLAIEDRSAVDRLQVTRTRLQAQHWLAAVTYRAYGAAFPLLCPLGIAGLALAIVLRRGTRLPLLALALASLVAVLSRIGLLAYLDVTSIPSANSLYASPASPFVIVLTVLGLHAGWAAARAPTKARPTG